MSILLITLTERGLCIMFDNLILVACIVVGFNVIFVSLLFIANYDDF